MSKENDGIDGGDYGNAENHEFQKHLTVLGGKYFPDSSEGLFDLIESKLAAGHVVRKDLSDTPATRDCFRNSHGFETLFTTLDFLVELCIAESAPEVLPQNCHHLLRLVFSILAASLEDHRGNQKYFRDRIPNGGWESLYQALEHFHRPSLEDKDKEETARVSDQHVLDCLFAWAINDETVLGLFDTEESQSVVKKTEQEFSNASDTTSPGHLDQKLGTTARLQTPEALNVAFRLWQQRQNGTRLLSSPRGIFVVQAISQLATQSTHNLLALHGTDLMSNLLSYLANRRVPSEYMETIFDVVLLLLSLGITKLDDAFVLYTNPSQSSVIARLLLPALQSSHAPSYFHFDLSIAGYSSLELPDLGASFPPSSPHSGYTVSLWFQVWKYDPNAHTTLFGAFDSTQTCFVLVYLEKDSHQLIFQTSVTSSRPSVRFKSVAFREGRWYHIALAHRRPSTTHSSRVSLFVNGNFAEQVKSNYPLPSPVAKGKADSSDGLFEHTKRHAIQAFVGTPQDLASQLGQGLVCCQWRMASAHVFNDVLTDDLVAVHYELGPRYYGNYQDCLGSFNTYQAAASLKIRNDQLHSGKPRQSDIIHAMETGASELLPEKKVLLALSPASVLRTDDFSTSDAVTVPKYISKTATKTVRNLAHKGHVSAIVNGSVPAISEAFNQRRGLAVLTGSPATIRMQSLDDAAWRIGGCTAIILNIFDRAADGEASIRALECVFESLRDNWRCSEAMERDNGFAVLMSLIAKKIQDNMEQDIEEEAKADFAIRILNAILKFLGFRKDKPEHSVLNNPLAYRVLLVDADFWRAMPLPVQNLYYEQFDIFGVQSIYHVFNAKRLSKMRIIKKWLDALKTSSFHSSPFQPFLAAFRSMLAINMTADYLRSVAMYITFALEHGHHDEQRSQARLAHTVCEERDSAQTQKAEPTEESSAVEDDELSTDRMGMRLLELYADLICVKDDTTSIAKFSKAVTDKWLLNLLVNKDVGVVTPAVKILARMLVVNGANYVKRFTEETGGMIILQHRLQQWWYIPAIWRICFAILFGRDVALVRFDRPLTLFNLVDDFTDGGKCHVLYPEVLPVLLVMMQNGLRTLLQVSDKVELNASQDDLSSGSLGVVRRGLVSKAEENAGQSWTAQAHPSTETETDSDFASTLRTIIRFLADMHSRSSEFRDFAVGSKYVQELLFTLYPLIVNSEVAEPDSELRSEASLPVSGQAPRRPSSRSSMTRPFAMRRPEIENNNLRPELPILRRMSSYVLVKANDPNTQATPPKLRSPLSLGKAQNPANLVDQSISEELLEIIIAVYSDQIFNRKDFPGLGLFMKVPPGIKEDQALFESFILQNTITHLGNSIRLNQKLLWEPRVLTNLQRFAGHLGEAVFEGWFIDGAEVVLDFVAGILEYIYHPEVYRMKSIRLCDQIIGTVEEVLLRVSLLRLSETDEANQPIETIAFMHKLAYWQSVLFAAASNHHSFLRLFCFLLYKKLTSTDDRAKASAADLWRLLLVQRPHETARIFQRANVGRTDNLSKGFNDLTKIDNEQFLAWVDSNREDLDGVFFRSLSDSWTAFVTEENRNTEEASKGRLSKRREKLKQWSSQAAFRDATMHRHEISCDHWRSNIYASEIVRKQRAIQDQQNNSTFNDMTWGQLRRGLERPCAPLETSKPLRWQLDQTEGRNRMRLRMVLDPDPDLRDIHPKRKASRGPSQHRKSTLGTRRRTVSKAKPPVARASTAPVPGPDGQGNASKQEVAVDGANDDMEDEEDFEMVGDPRAGIDDTEDKNRKVLRSLHRNDQVEYVHNVSRIIGLEGFEGLLILGKHHLYLLDGLFQRSDGEIVNVSQAPPDERDSYLQMISGREPWERVITTRKSEQEVRSWHQTEILSISKRRFLFRDVAMEVFFNDGRSYLLTTNDLESRDDLYQKLLGKTSAASGRALPTTEEGSWRFESVQSLADQSQSLGSRFTSVFAQTNSDPATRRWIQGEMSNFNYLMHVNTMAGRTFNDLTQYPVFPWVLADYTSEELDLTDPRSYRDLMKPMGCQTQERQAEFRDRYQSFAEMGDHNAPPFHYGTHYSTAMIVTSYLIRLQPFVQSYLLLQGGSFDHPDRLFYSIEKAWASASRENTTDVRELIPEFFYLPEFLLNLNGYDFGERQGDGGTIDQVALPPWAKGDPKIFIAKNREALESEHVSSNLHHWIDLIFGHKQQGESALEATNVFHHLSYRGARDLDKISDPVERLATIGIIHNFGQTPHQVFQRNHPAREDGKRIAKQIDTMAEGLTRLPSAVFEINDRIASLQYSTKLDRLLCSGPSRINIAPTYDKYLEWGFVDGGIRFYAADSNKLIGLFEHVHVSQLSAVLFVDSQTLVTAGEDCVVSVWTVTYPSSHAVDLQPRGSLFGHRTAVTTLAASSSFRTLLSGSEDGQILIWDLNRLEIMRKLTERGSPRVSCARIHDVNGTIVVCRGPDLSLYTLNGEVIVEQNVCTEEDRVVCCSFFEGSGNEFLERQLVFTGHGRGVVNVWNVAIRRGEWVLEHLRGMYHDGLGSGRGVSGGTGGGIREGMAAITCVLPLKRRVFTGDEEGRVYEWQVVQRQ